MNSLNHVAIIMDGNGRWAKKRNLPRTAGHKQGTQKVRDIAIHASKKGVKCLTLFAFSTENWKRNEKEVNYIMSLPKVFFKSYMKDLMKYNMKVTMIGDKAKLPKQTREVIEDAIKGTSKNTGMILNFAMNYGSRADIAKAASKIAKDYKKGKLKNIKEDTISNYLSTSKLPEVDLMIRTSNEIRISNFLLYELAYSELIFIDKYWPDFSEKDFDNCLEEYNNRTRRFGDAK